MGIGKERIKKKRQYVTYLRGGIKKAIEIRNNYYRTPSVMPQGMTASSKRKPQLSVDGMIIDYKILFL